MPKLDFFYFFGSGYAYLSVMRIEQLAAAAGVEVHWRPFSVRTLMQENGTRLREQPRKMAYIWRDIERRAALHGIPFRAPPPWPTDSRQLANHVAIVAAAQGWLIDYTVASFRDWYVEGRELGDDANLRRILAALGRDPDAVIAEATSPATLARYEQETDAARRLGVFGSPAFVVDGEVFWGDDRLEEAFAWACGTHPAQRRA
jgi:2-hydroxychromene-2-carboxylate isomerase